MNAVAAGEGNTSFCLTIVGFPVSPCRSGKVLLTNIVLAQWDGEEETIEGGNGSQEEKTADISLWGRHQAEVVHGGDSSDEEGCEAT